MGIRQSKLVWRGGSFARGLSGGRGWGEDCRSLRIRDMRIIRYSEVDVLVVTGFSAPKDVVRVWISVRRGRSRVVWVSGERCDPCSG